MYLQDYLLYKLILFLQKFFEREEENSINRHSLSTSYNFTFTSKVF